MFGFHISMLVIRSWGKYESVSHKSKFYGSKVTDGQIYTLHFTLSSLYKLVYPDSGLGVLYWIWVLKMVPRMGTTIRE